jgi:hypothetical protein
MTFRVGEEVVCVNDSFSAGWRIVKNRPRAGVVYTIRAVTIFDFGGETVPGVLLVEVVNPVENWTGGDVCECPFWIARFRPIGDRKSGISFTQGADPSSDRFDNRRVKVGAPA